MNYHDDPNEVIPTPAQQRKAMKQSFDEARGHLEDALNSLDKARTEFAWLSDDGRWRDCSPIIAMTEDLKDSMEVDDD